MAQKNDLQKAKEDLEQIIRKINNTTKGQFKETFEEIRENFKNVFAQLFEGGQADLILTDPLNILESGVEIFAQPPGKKLQSLTLLSGGEKALTAVALLFAFYLVRPAPFCLLDEADAPLDDANIERFLNLLETFIEKSQFLLITHNKRTMLRGDVIYGITMEEFGVSKVISMKIENVSEAVAV
jgi:chromosome segregation protein